MFCPNRHLEGLESDPIPFIGLDEPPLVDEKPVRTDLNEVAFVGDRAGNGAAVDKGAVRALMVDDEERAVVLALY